MQAKDLTGKRFGKLVAVEAFSAGGVRRWRCVCDCGGESTPDTNSLTSGNSTGCGRCRAHRGPTVHGFASPGKQTGAYKSWAAMRRRVLDKARYAGRGDAYLNVTCDPRWAEFGPFLEDMGERPEGMTLDRVNNALGYFKGNCRWATPTEQTRNRRISKTFTRDGRTQSVREWADELGITYDAAIARVRRHNSLELPNDKRGLVSTRYGRDQLGRLA